MAVGSVVTESECTSVAFSFISSFAVHLYRSQQDDGERSTYARKGLGAVGWVG